MLQRQKTGDSKQGTPNKTTALHKEFVQNLLNDQTEKLKRELNKLQGKDYIMAVLQLTVFVLPKMQRRQVEFKNDSPVPQAPCIVTIIERE
jgi:hypothetical protein